MIAWVGAAPSGNRKRAVSTVEHTDQPPKKVKSTAPKSIKPTTVTQRGQSNKFMCILVFKFINPSYTVRTSSKASYN
jgi:hypothetical protein